MTTTADKIRALMINNDRPELGGEWNLSLEAAAALVEAEPQAVRVKPVIWAIARGSHGVCVGGRWDGWMMVKHADGYWVSDHKLEAVDPAKSGNDSILAAIDLTPPPVDASPAPDPVSKERLEDDVSHSDDVAVNRFARAMKAKLAQARTKGRGGWDDPSQCSELYLAKLLVGHLGKGNPGTFEDVANFAMMLHQRGANPCVLKQAISVLPAPGPVSPTLDALAMKRAAIAMCRDVAENAISVPVGRAFKRMSENMVGLTMPSPADALREALQLPEVVALVEAAEAVIRDFHGDNAIGVAHLTKLRAALKGVK